jgi:hypothetical protein
MPRRNRNAGIPRPDTDQLAADLAWLAAELCPDTRATGTPGTGTTDAAARYLTRYLARLNQAIYPLAVTIANQPIPQPADESR